MREYKPPPLQINLSNCLWSTRLCWSFGESCYKNHKTRKANYTPRRFLSCANIGAPKRRFPRIAAAVGKQKKLFNRMEVANRERRVRGRHNGRGAGKVHARRKSTSADIARPQSRCFRAPRLAYRYTYVRVIPKAAGVRLVAASPQPNLRGFYEQQVNVLAGIMSSRPTGRCAMVNLFYGRLGRNVRLSPAIIGVIWSVGSIRSIDCIPANVREGDLLFRDR